MKSLLRLMLIQTWGSQHGAANMGQSVWGSQPGAVNMVSVSLEQSTWGSQPGAVNLEQ